MLSRIMQSYPAGALVICGLAASTFLGCSPQETATTGRVGVLETKLAQKDRHIKKLESDLKSREQSLEHYRRQAQNTRQPAPQPAMARQASHSGNSPLPPAKPGECFARVFVPPTYGTATEKVLNSEASERLEVIPAEYKWVEEKIVVQPASKRLEEIPAQYDWVEEKVLVKEAHTEFQPIQPEYKMVEEKVLVTPARTEWKPGRGPIEKVDNMTGEIMCLVDVPAVYKTVTKRVLAKPASVKEVKIPAEYTTIKKRVMIKPATVKEIVIPAQYETVKVRKLASPARTKRIKVPAEYETVTKQVQKTEGRMEWRRVLCETNSTPEMIGRIEGALESAGHDPGPVDGIMDDRTYAAIRSFQQSNNLEVGGLTYQTLERLGVKVNK